MERKERRERSRRTLRTILHGSKRFFALCILSGALLTLCEMLIPQVIRVTVDSVIGSRPVALPGALAAAVRPEELRARMWLIALVLAGLGLLSAAFRFATNLFDAKAGETLVKTARDRLYTHIQTLPWTWHSENPTGDIIQRCTSDVEVIKTFFQEQFVAVFRIVVQIVLAMVFMILMNFRLALVPLVMFPVIVTYSVIFHNRIRERFLQCDENEGILSTIAQENLTGVRVVRAFGREAAERDRFEEQNQRYTSLWVELCRTLSNFWAIGDLTSCLQVMLVVTVGAVLCVRGSMTSGEFISFAFYNGMLIGPVRRLGRMISEMSKAGVSIQRIGAILDAEPERDAPGAEEAPMDGDIEFDNVSFAYPGGEQVLSDVSFTVAAGSRFGILGGTGSGKSSLIMLLCRLYAPESGQIRVGGRDIAGMPAKWVRRNVGVVLQEPFLFSRTVGENIGILGASTEEVEAAAETACIRSDILDFTKGFDTLVGERGVTLSGGQKQRVAIARSLTARAPILVFDDSLSAVDTETDEKIRTALERSAGHATTIVISHRITTLLDCDRVLVLNRGRVEQLGAPRELLAREGLFRTIYEMQASVEEEAV